MSDTPGDEALEWMQQLRDMLTQGEGQRAATLIRDTFRVDPASLFPTPAPAPVPFPASTVAFPNFTAKLPDPHKFNGNAEEVEPYIATLNERFALTAFSGFSDTDRVTYFSSFLTGPGFKWHNSMRTSNPAALHNYSAYVAAFREQFEDRNLVRNVREKIEKLTQTKSVSDYAAEFKSLAALAKMEPLHQRDAFWKGLKSDVQQALAIRGISNSPFEMICKQAIEYDQVMFNLKKSTRQPYSNTAYNNRPSPSKNANQFTSSQVGNSGPPAPSPSVSGPWPMEIDAIKLRLVKGRLPPEEVKRRADNKLCMYCAAPGHTKDNCPKRSGKGKPTA